MLNNTHIKSCELPSWRETSSLIAESWKENADAPLDYTPEFIEHLATFPDASGIIAPTLCDCDRVVAFAIGFPRKFFFGAQLLKLALTTFFTVAPGYKGKGLGRRIWAECIKRAYEGGYDGVLYYCAGENASNVVTLAGVHEAGFSASHIFTIRYLYRSLADISKATRSRSDMKVQHFKSVRV